MIITAKCSRASAKLLRDTINDLTGKRLLVTSRVTDVIKHNTQIVLRYGNPTPLPNQEKHRDTKFNSVKDISYLSNKKTVALQLLNMGFVAPKFISRFPPDSNNFPLLIRESLTAYKGKGIHVVENIDEFNSIWKEGFYWCDWIPTVAEYRVHVVKSPKTGDIRILRANKKVLREGEEKEKYPIRVNIKYKFSLRSEPLKQFPKLAKDVLDAAKTLPGYFYSFDVGWSSELSQTVFFETNTASGLDGGSVVDYAKYFIDEGIV